MPWGAVFLATIIASIIGTLVMGLVANVPYAQAPGMGLNAFFVYTVCLGLGFTWQQALSMVFICGLFNIVITVTKIRKYIIKAIPKSLQNAIGGGIGVPPIRGCAQYTAKKSTAIVGFRSKEKAILLYHLEEECAKVMVATDDGSLGYHGFVDALVRQELERDKNYDAVLACGPKLMLRNVAKVAQEFGVPCQVSMEERMGCGVGACLVCACDMKDGSRKHVCKDGPVFDSKEVDWDA